MLKTELINPQIMSALSRCGHGSKILIADANYPLAERSGTAEKVYLGLCRGLPTATQVLETVLSAVNVEKAEVMMPEDSSEPEIFAEFREKLGNVPLEGTGRYDFYDRCMQKDGLVLAIGTGEQRTFANILLTIGVA
ncbi:MAG: RbsD/FucU domain-containing protein [Candidatus Limivicinus sp.]|jgi:L-fucose mutarotase